MELRHFVKQYLNIEIQSNIRVTGLTDSDRTGTLSFLDNIDFLDTVKNNQHITAVLIREKDAVLLPENIEGIISDSPKAAFFDLHNKYCRQCLTYEPNNIAQSAVIHPSAVIAGCGVTIGENTVIGANTTILGGVCIGHDTTIGPNCVLGCDGFHVYTDTSGIQRIVAHDGKAIIGNYVDIQASVTVDKGLMGRDTVIGNECKIDNASHITHRVHIGEKTLIASSVCIAGSAEIGKNVWIGPQSVISNRINICDNAKILIGSVVIQNITRPISVSGNFAVEHIRHLRTMWK